MAGGRQVVGHVGAGCVWRALVVLAAMMLAVGPGAPTVACAEPMVDLRLVLAVDASGSVDDARFELQRSGYATAFRNASVLKAIKSGARGAIAVTMMQWTGPALQVQVVPWMHVASAEEIQQLAAAIAGAPRRLFSGGTSISGAIDKSMGLLSSAPYAATRSVVDISGDGANNRGRPAASARDDAIAAGVVINGLPILEREPDLDQHYLHNVIGGPNSFMVPVETFEEFADAILKKLITEIADQTPIGPLTTAQLRKACRLC